jgi:hypothetical protein
MKQFEVVLKREETVQRFFWEKVVFSEAVVQANVQRAIMGSDWRIVSISEI